MSSHKAEQLPKNWPIDTSLEYLSKPKYTKGMTTSIRQSLHSVPTSVATDKLNIVTSPAAPNALVRITPIKIPSHPAFKQHGLFATRTLPADSLIIIYLGVIHTAADTDQASDYDLSMDRELGIGIDAQSCGNEARFINDYRGVAERPNAEFRDCWVRVGPAIERRIGVFVKKDVKKGIGKGHEILVSYGKGFWSNRLQDSPESRSIQMP